MRHHLYPFHFLLCVLWGAVLWVALANPLDAATEQPPGKLELIGRIGGPALAVAAQGHYAYVGHSFEFAVLDLSDPANPIRIGWLPIAANDIVVEGQYAYVAGREGLSIVDISKPTQPMVVGTLPTALTVSGVALAGHYVYLVDGLGGFGVVDVAQPTRPIKRSQQRVDQRAEGVTVVGHLAYVATYTGLQVLDVADPTQPRRLGFTAEPGWSQNVVVRGDYAYVTTLQGVAVVKISDSTQPVQVALLPLPEYADGVQMVGDELFIANARQGVRVFNVTTPAAPRLISVTPLTGALLDMAVTDDYALLTDVMTGNITVLAIDNPTNPVVLGAYHAPGMSTGVAVAGDYAYVAADTTGDLHILHVADPTQPVESAFYQTKLSSRHVAVEGAVVYVFDEHGTAEGIAMRDPTQAVMVDAKAMQQVLLRRNHLAAQAATQLRQIMPTVTVMDVVRQGNFIYFSVDDRSIRIVDATDPTDPVLVAIYATPDVPQSLAIKGDTIFVANGFGGLLVLKLR